MKVAPIKSSRPGSDSGGTNTITYNFATSIHFLLRLAAQSLDAAFVRHASTLTFRQFVVLNAIKIADGNSQTTLVHLTGIDRSTMADLVSRLQRQGLVSRRRRKADARAYQVTLTELGHRVLSQGVIAARLVDTEIASIVDASDRRQILECLRRLAHPKMPDEPFPVTAGNVALDGD